MPKTNSTMVVQRRLTCELVPIPIRRQRHYARPLAARPDIKSIRIR